MPSPWGGPYTFGVGPSRAIGVAALAVLLASSSADARPFKKGPYLQNVSKVSVTVMWESSDPMAGVVRVYDRGRDKPARELASERDEMHEVVIDGLEPGKRYHYEVICGDKKVGGEFATAPTAGSPFSFVVFGDSRSNHGSHRRVVERVRREVPDFLLSTGDMVDDAGRLNQWQQFFDIERDLLRENVMYPSLGNHDRQGRGRTADNYRRFFSVPENSPDPERYYAFTYGNARFLILDSNVYGFALSDQNAWIERQLQSARLDKSIKHIFVSMHHPPFSISLHGGRRELREAWTPLFEKYQVDAVFSGHDHVYSRAKHNGVNYFVSGGGGAPLYPRGRRVSAIDRRATKYFERVNHFLRVHVVGDFVEVSAFRVDGTLVEAISWGKAPRVDLKAVGGPLAVSDPAPQVQERPAVVKEASPRTQSGFGFLGKLGAVVMVVAGGVLFWSLRRG